MSGDTPSIGSRGFFDLGGLYGHKPPPEILPHNPTVTDEDRFLAAVNGPPEVPAMKERTLPPAKGTTKSTILIDGELILDLGGGRALVYSKSSPGHWHEIVDDTCSCDGFAKWDKVCRHLRAARQLGDGIDRVGMLELPLAGTDGKSDKDIYTVPIPHKQYDQAMTEPAIHEERPQLCPECNLRPVAIVLGKPARTCGRCALTPKFIDG